MGWDEFTTCMGDAGSQVADAIKQIGQGGIEVIKEVAQLWRELPLDVKSFIIASARYGAPLLIAALEAAGITAGAALEVLADVAIAVGVGVLMAALVGCSAQLT